LRTPFSTSRAGANHVSFFGGAALYSWNGPTFGVQEAKWSI
jgi:hypothetical protein